MVFLPKSTFYQVHYLAKNELINYYFNFFKSLMQLLKYQTRNDEFSLQVFMPTEFTMSRLF